MDFREATDVLLEPFTISHLARALEVSEASVRQARLRNGKGVRQPPKGWEDRLVSLAKERARVLLDATANIRRAVEAYNGGESGGSPSGDEERGAAPVSTVRRSAGVRVGRGSRPQPATSPGEVPGVPVEGNGSGVVGPAVTPFRGPITKAEQTRKRGKNV